MPILLSQHLYPKYVSTTNFTSTSWTSRTPTATEPTITTTNGRFSLASEGEVPAPNGLHTPSHMKLWFFGTSAANQTFLARLYGLEKTTDATPIWFYTLLYQFTVTLGNVTGVSGATLSDSNYLADTIAVTVGNDNVDLVRSSPASQTIDDVPGVVLVDCKGFSLFQMDFHRNSSAASCNALYAGA